MSEGLRPYPEYRESGVAWLGRVPAHWKVMRSRYIFREVDVRSSTGSEVHLSMSQRLGLVERDQVEERRLVSESYVGAKLCEPGDLVLNRLKAHLGVFARADQAGLVSPDYTVLRRIHASVLTRYFEHVLRSPECRGELRTRTKGLVEGFWRLYTDDFYTIALPAPPREEQEAIVRYVAAADHRIRRYIRAKQRLIALLEEQKRLIVHRAVTRGLDPEVPLKPSGVDWLGDVPAHWRVLRLRHAVEMVVSNVDKLTTPGEEPVRLCNYVDVHKNERITDDLAFMAATATRTEIARFRVRVGDVLITKDSEVWNDIGVPALVEHEALDLVCGYHLAMLRPRPSVVLGAFLLRALQSRAVATQLHVGANGVTRYGLTQATIKDALVAVPPKDEQAAIVRHVDAELTAMRDASRRATEEIALLGEYRTRLVADVVTGKLDVRAAAARLPNLVVEPDAASLDDGELLDEDAVEEVPDLEPAEA